MTTTARNDTPIAYDPAGTRDAWDRIAAGYDEHVTPTHFWIGSEGLRRAGPRPGMRFLDVAAGSGALSIPAARLGARVLATDLSPVMLERLRARAAAEGLDVETRVMDGHALALDDDAFDVAGSQYGVMLFPDAPRGIRELVRVTRPGGRVLLNVYGAPDRVEFFAFFVRAIRTVVPSFAGPPMDPPPLPFQFADPARLRGALADAGLGDVRVETLSEPTTFESGRRMWSWLLNSNPVAGAVLAGARLTEAQTADVVRALDALLRERAGGGGAAVLTAPVHVGVGTTGAR